MFIEVNKIAPEGLEIDRALDLPPVLQAGGEPASLEGVRVIGYFGRVGSDFAFRGKVEAVISLTCSRCLVEFPLALRGACHRIYRAGPLSRTGGEGALAEHDLALTPFDGARIDLDELVQEQIYLLLPLKPLCNEACGGLCPRCGTDRNLAPCACPEDRQGPEPLTLKIPL